MREPVVDLTRFRADILHLRHEQTRVSKTRISAVSCPLFMDSKCVQEIVTPIRMRSLVEFEATMNGLLKFKVDLPADRHFEKFVAPLALPVYRRSSAASRNPLYGQF
jgi:hypothetical protein